MMNFPKFVFSFVLLLTLSFFHENYAEDYPICPCGTRPTGLKSKKNQNPSSETMRKNTSTAEMGKILNGAEVGVGFAAESEFYWQGNAIFEYDAPIPGVNPPAGIGGIPIVSDQMAHFCSAAAIGNYWILLAAHCCVKYDSVVLNLPTGSVILPTGVLAALFPLPIDLLVRNAFPTVAYPDWTKIDKVSISFEPNLQTDISKREKIVGIYKHPNFSWKDFGHDLCLIQLAKSIDRKKNGPLCLPSADEDLLEGERKMSGWGLTKCTDTATLPNRFTKAQNIWTYPQDLCVAAFPGNPPIHADVCCIESKYTTNQSPTIPYSGDSGTAIVRPGVPTGSGSQVKDIHAAILSFGKKCDQKNPDKNRISGASATSPDMKWIRETIAMAEKKPFDQVICPTLP